MADVLKKRKVDDSDRDRLMTPDGELDAGGGSGGTNDVLKVLQQQAGNAAVGSLLQSKGTTQAAGKPAAKATGKPAGSGGGAGSGASFEGELFERSILSPLRAAYACVRDSPPDHELALQHLQTVGEALWEYEQRYRGSDEGLANGFYAARGWLGRVARELTVRLGSAKPMSDETIALFVSDTISDLNGLQNRLR